MGWLKKRVAFRQGVGRLPNKSNSDAQGLGLGLNQYDVVWLNLKLTLTGDFHVISITAFLALNNTWMGKYSDYLSQTP